MCLRKIGDGTDLLLRDECGLIVAGGARKVALMLRGAGEEEDRSTMLLSDIREILTGRKGADRIGSDDLAGNLAAMEDRPWYDGGERNGFSPNQLARQLAPHGIKPKVLWGAKAFGQGSARGHEFKYLEEAFYRYLDPLGVMGKSPPPHPSKENVRAHLSSMRR